MNFLPTFLKKNQSLPGLHKGGKRRQRAVQVTKAEAKRLMQPLDVAAPAAQVTATVRCHQRGQTTSGAPMAHTTAGCEGRAARPEMLQPLGDVELG